MSVGCDTRVGCTCYEWCVPPLRPLRPLAAAQHAGGTCRMRHATATRGPIISVALPSCQAVLPATRPLDGVCHPDPARPSQQVQRKAQKGAARTACTCSAAWIRLWFMWQCAGRRAVLCCAAGAAPAGPPRRCAPDPTSWITAAPSALLICLVPTTRPPLARVPVMMGQRAHLL